MNNADEATIYIAAGTTYYHGENYIEKTLEQLEAAKEKGYQALRAEHIKDYKNLYDRVSVHISSGENTEPTDVRLEKVKRAERDNGLVELYFNFARTASEIMGQHIENQVTAVTDSLRHK